MRADQERVDMSVPLPLGYHKALDRAAVLRELNPRVWTWSTIAEVMRVYHGFDRAAGWWRRSLRGRVEARPRGVPLAGSERRVRS